MFNFNPTLPFKPRLSIEIYLYNQQWSNDPQILAYNTFQSFNHSDASYHTVYELVLINKAAKFENMTKNTE